MLPGHVLCRQGEVGGTVLFAVMTPVAVEKDDKEIEVFAGKAKVRAM